MKFGIDKCAVLELERGRLVRSEGIELPDGERMKEVDQEGYIKYLQLDKTTNKEMKENIRRVKLIWLECLGYRCDEVQQKNYRLGKRRTSGHGPLN